MRGQWFRSHSVRVSLTLWNVAAMIFVIAVYAAGVFVFVGRNASAALDESIHEDFQWAAEMAESEPGRPPRWFQNLDNFGDDSPWLRVWSGGKIIFSTLKAERNPINGTDELFQHPSSGIVSIPGSTTIYRVLTAPSTINNQQVIIQVIRSETAMRRELGRLLVILLLGLPVGVGAAGVAGYSLARSALAPVETMAERASSITADRLHDRLPVENPNNELGRLAAVFNETLGRLETSFQQMRSFTADVSHELRTPLTAIRSVGEVGLRERRDEGAYRAIIASMLEEVDRLASLVDRLLTWSRAETGQAKLAQEVIDLYELSQEVVNHLGVLAEEKGQTLTLEQSGRPRGLADRLVLRQSLINLVDNAIKYSPARGTIRVRVAELPTTVTIDVADTGPGIAPEMRARIFERYDRGGRSTSSASDIGGAGLGLSISKWAVEVNGGHLTLESSTGMGSTFRLTLPRSGAVRTPDSRRKSVA